MTNTWEKTPTEEGKINMFEQLWTDVRYFLDNLGIGESEVLKQRLESIKKDIKMLTKIALMRNLERTDDPQITFSGKKNMRVETKNFYPNILDIDAENRERKLIAYATKWSVQKTIKELEAILAKKITEDSYRNEILHSRTYTEVLDLLKMRFLKIEDKILAFESIHNDREANRIGLLLYMLGCMFWHKLRVYGNETEAYIYDTTIDKTFICGNTTGYKTYVSDWKKDLYDIWELSKDEIEKEFTSVDFHSAQQREISINELCSTEKKSETKITKKKEQSNADQKDTAKEIMTTNDSHRDTNTENKIISEEIQSDTQQVTPENTETMEEQLAIHEWEKDQIENGKETTNDLIRAEFLNKYQDTKRFDYEAFKSYLKDTHNIDLPAKLSSLNSFFGRNPYIFVPKYTIAILENDKEKIKNIEKEMRDKRYEYAKGPESQNIRDIFTQYFSLQTDQEKKEFKKENPDVFKNLRHKAQRLWWLTIWSEEYIQALLENNPAKCFVVAEKEYVTKICRCFPYSKKVSDLAKDFKDKKWDIKNLSKYMEYMSKWYNPMIVKWDVVVEQNNHDDKKPRASLYSRLSSDTLSKEDIITIFKNTSTGKLEVTQDTYEWYLKEHAAQQNELPKTIYDLINYFKDEDPYANNMIHSIKYLQALLEWDRVKAKMERYAYMKKKIEESKKPDIQRILMFVWNYMNKYGDKSCSEWISLAKPDTIDRIMKQNPHLEKRILNNAYSIVSYCVTDINNNFNIIDYGSLKNILSPKINQIREIAPAIYNQSFNVT